jgi:hypothetical protein
MRKHRVTTVQELNAMRTQTSVRQTRGPEGHFGESLREYNARIAREAKENEEKQAAALKSLTDHAQAETNRLLQESNSIHKELTKRFWGGATVPKRREWSNNWLKDEVLDSFVGLEDGTFDQSASETSYLEFIKTAPSLVGHAVNEGNGRQRLASFGLAQSIVGNKRVTTAADWTKCFLRLLDCEAYRDGELTACPEQKTAVEPAPTRPARREGSPQEPTYADLEALNLSTREGMKDAHRIADRLYNLEVNEVAAAWSESLRVNFGLSLDAVQIQAVHDWFAKNPTMSWKSPRSFDLCRLALVRNHIFPQTAMTNVERFNRDEMESADFGSMGFAQKQELKRNAEEALRKDREQFGH